MRFPLTQARADNRPSPRAKTSSKTDETFKFNNLGKPAMGSSTRVANCSGTEQDILQMQMPSTRDMADREAEAEEMISAVNNKQRE